MIAPDRARRGLHGVGGAGEPAERLDRARPLDHHRDERPAGDEVDERAEERLLPVLVVVGLGDLALERAELQRDELQALALDARDHVTDEPTAHAVGLDEDKSAFGHGWFSSGHGCDLGASVWAAVAWSVVWRTTAVGGAAISWPRHPGRRDPRRDRCRRRRGAPRPGL